MVDGVWLSLLFILLAVGIVSFIFKQIKNMESVVIIPASNSPDFKELRDKEKRVRKCVEDIGDHFSKGAKAFVKSEMVIMLTFVCSMGLVVFGLTGGRGRKEYMPNIKPGGEPLTMFVMDWGFGFLSAVAFLCGAGTSFGAGYLGIYAATQANTRVALMLMDGRDADSRPNIQKGFETCLRGGAIMSFGMFTMATCNIFLLTSLYLFWFDGCISPIHCNHKSVCYCLLSYALGASLASIMRRVGGSIYMKATDLCRLTLANDPVQSINLPEFDARNPATVAEGVGDIVGDVAGSAADLFGTFTMAIVAMLGIMGSTTNSLEMDLRTPIISHWSLMCLPLIVAETGIVVSVILYLLTVNKNSPFNPDITKTPNRQDAPVSQAQMPTRKGMALEKDYVKINLNRALLNQVAASAGIHAFFMFILIIIMLPDSLYVNYWYDGGLRPLSDLLVTDWMLSICACIGSLTGLVGGYIGLYYTSEGSEDALIERGGPVREVYDACQYSENAAVVTIVGLSVGYQATTVTVLNIAVGIYAAHALGHGLGVAFAAMGAVGSICSVLVTTTFGPIAKNAHAITVMSGMNEEARRAGDQLATAGRNVLALSKGYSITVAALVAFALMECFVLRADVSRASISIFHPLCFAGLLIGAMLPYLISAMVIQAICNAAKKVKENVQGQFLRNAEDIMFGQVRPDYEDCISEATMAALTNLIPIGMIMVMVPLTTGLMFGKAAVAGLVIGCIISAVPHACSCATSGGIWSTTRQLLQTNYYGPSVGYDEWKARLMLAETLDEEDLKAQEEDVNDIIRNLEKCQPQPAYEVARIGESIAGPLQDAIAPTMSILMKDMAILSCVLGPYFASTRGGFGVFGCEMVRQCNEEEYPLEGFDTIMYILYGVGFVVFCVVSLYRNCFAPKELQTSNPNQPMSQAKAKTKAKTKAKAEDKYQNEDDNSSTSLIQGGNQPLDYGTSPQRRSQPVAVSNEDPLGVF